jgi:hypothetical protein
MVLLLEKTYEKIAVYGAQCISLKDPYPQLN